MQLQCAQHTPQATQKQLQTDQNNVKSSTGKRRPNFIGAEVEVLLQNVDVSILFHYGYIHAIELVLIYLFTAICSVRIVLLFMSRDYKC